MSRATEPSEGSSPELDIIFDEIIRKLDFPVIVTDARGRPTSWRNLPVENPDSTQLVGLMYVLDSEHEPVPLAVAEGDSTRKLGEIHYGLSASAVTLRNVNGRSDAPAKMSRPPGSTVTPWSGPNAASLPGPESSNNPPCWTVTRSSKVKP